MKELQKFAKPPLICLTIFKGVGVLLEPSKNNWEWTDDQRLLAGIDGPLVERLLKFDRDSITDEQLKRLNTILENDECQPKLILKASIGCYALFLWIKAMAEYATNKGHIQSS